jgi:hypothetical protein
MSSVAKQRLLRVLLDLREEASKCRRAYANDRNPESAGSAHYRGVAEGIGHAVDEIVPPCKSTRRKCGAPKWTWPSAIRSPERRCSMANPHDRDADIVLVPDSAPKAPDAVDELIDAYEHYEQAEKACRAEKLKIVAQLAALAPQTDDCRTTRLRGEHRRVKLEYPESSWDQSRLKECWHAYPKFRDEFLTISSLRVKLRDFKKAVHEKGPADFETFLGMLADANRGPQGMPRIVLEEGRP